MQPTETQPPALKPCSKCGKPRPVGERCKDCRQEQKHAWYVANKERHQEQGRAWRVANQDRVRELNRIWRAANKEHVRQEKRAWHEANLERKRELQRAWQSANREKVRASIRASSHRRRAAQQGTAAERFTDIEIFERDAWRCHICKRQVRQTLKHPHPKSVSLDHIVPLSRGGTHTRDNVACAHLKCNLAKNAFMRGGVQPLLIA